MQKQETKPRAKGFRGDLYQIKILMMFLYRGIAQNYSFRLGTEIEEAQKFDDLVFEYTRNNKKFYRFLQAKHHSNERDKITADSLLTDADKNFSLVKYFFSYWSIKYDKFFEKGSIEDIILYTNIGFDVDNLRGKGIEINEVLQPDPILDTKRSTINKHKKSTRYRFGPNMVNLLKPVIIKYYPRKLAKHLVKFILENKTIAKEGDLFGKYHKALSKEVIDVKNKKFYESFIEDKGLSLHALEFRGYFKDEIQERSDNELNLANLNKALKEKKEIKGKPIGLPVRKDFAKCHTHNWPDFHGIEVDVKVFIDHLVFAVNQPNEEELGKELLAEIGSQFVYNELFHRMLHLLIAQYQKERFYSRDEGIKLINDIRKEILSLQMPGFKDHLDSVPYKFQSTDELQKFISSRQNLWLLSTETPWLSSLVLHQSFEDKNCEFSYYNIKWIDLYENRGSFISNFEDLDHFLIIVTCLQMVGTEKLTCTILNIINDILYKSISKKVIVIASEYHEFMKQMKIKYHDTQNFYKEELKFEFSDLDVESQKLLLENRTIYFRAKSNKRSITQLLCSEGQTLSHHQITLLNLDALELEILLRNSNIEMWDESNQKSDFTSEIFKSNTLINFPDLRKAIESSENDIFAFYGDEEEIKILILNLDVGLKTIPEIESTFCHHRFILLSADKKLKEFNYLCHLTNNCNCNQANHVIHELKIEGSELMWLQTYSQNFYIPRFLNPLFTEKDMNDMLVVSDSPEFVVFSRIRKKCLMSLLHINSITDKRNFSKNCIVKPSEKSAERTFNSMKKIMNQDKVYAPDNTYIKILPLIRKKGICWIRAWEASGSLQFEWVQSVGDCRKLLRARSRGNPFEPEKCLADFRQRYLTFARRSDSSNMTGCPENYYKSYLSETSLKELRQRLVVIADEPGMGKSCTLTRFANLIEKKGKQSIAIKIDLNKHQNSFSSNSVNTKETLMELLLHFSQSSRYQPLMRRILAYKLEFRDQMILLCDGFDEMTTENQNAVLTWIKFVMRETKASVWITTRPNHKETLENAFSVLAYSFKSLIEDDIKGYLSKFWKTTLMFSGKNPRHFDFRKVAEVVSNHFSPIFGITYTYSFTTFPFMLRILAEKYLEVSKRILIDNITDENLLDIEIKRIKSWDVYNAFVHQKYEIYFDVLEIKGRLDKDSELILRKSYSKAYGCLAARKLYNQFENIYSDSERENVLSLDTLSKIGLVQKRNDHDVSFIHPSFEEYFAFEFICNKLATSPFYESDLDFLLNGILVHSFSSRLFDDKLQNSSEFASIINTQQVKDIVYALLLDQVNSTVKPVALWNVAEDKLITTVRFLLTSVESLSKLEALLKYSTKRSMMITPENIDTLIEWCLNLGPRLVVKRSIQRR